MSHLIDKVTYFFSLLSTSVSSGSTGAGLPSGTGSVKYLSFSFDCDVGWFVFVIVSSFISL